MSEFSVGPRVGLPPSSSYQSARMFAVGQEVPTVEQPRGGGPGWRQWIGPGLAAAASLAGAWYSNHQSAKEAQKNRDFQEEMSNTSHQREVQDLIAAGINPILSASRGASTPSGGQGDVEQGVVPRALQAALSVAQARSQIHLTMAQADQASSAAARSRQETWESGYRFPSELGISQARQRFEEAAASEKEQMVPLLLRSAQAEIERSLASARASRAASVLDEAAAAGAANQEQFEKDFGEMGPWTRLFFEALRSLNSVRR